ncbi:MAG TPA: hypothetical protein VNE39_11930 [Planctomycetota bacterium]|nr:hypothetical protein [Planctomycetota bacterium]
MSELLQPWNLVYVLAFFFALLYAVLNAIGLASHGADVDADADVDHDLGDLGVDHDIDVHADVDHDIDVHADVDHDVEVGVDHHVPDFHVDHDVHAEAPHAEPSVLEEALSFFGIGKVPLSVILMTFLITFAVVGWAVNAALAPVLLTPVAFFPISLAAAITCGLGGTKLLAGTLGRYLKPVDSAALRRGVLVGRIATAKLPVSATFGMALVRDDYGTLHKVTCRVREGAATIPKGQTILLVRYVPVKQPGRRASGYFIVEPYDVPTT